MDRDDRLLCDARVSPRLRRILARASAERAPNALLERVLSAVPLTAASGLTTVGASKARALSRLWWHSAAAKLSGTIATVVAAAAVGGYVSHQQRLRQVEHTRAAVSAALMPATPSFEPPAAPSTISSAAPTQSDEPVLQSTGATREPARGAAVPQSSGARAAVRLRSSGVIPSTSASNAPPAAGTREQLESLREIRKSVDSHHARDAVTRIAAHRARFSANQFEQELALLELEARVELEQTGVCPRIERFLEAYPRSLFVPRIESLRAQWACRP